MDLVKIIKDHEVWFDSMGENGKKADLRGLNLENTQFRNVRLIEADLMGGNFSYSDFSGADLRGANLQDANLSNAIFCGANLEEVDLMWANSKNADFSGANLKGSYLNGADLRGAKGLLLEQVAVALMDEETLLPDYLNDKLA
jgi:uncharacterized protein YjbI with pentapeptide repeats